MNETRPCTALRTDGGFRVLEPTPRGAFIEDGAILVHLGKLLVSWGWLPSNNEMRKLHGKARFKIIPADGTCNLSEPIFATREVNATFALFPGDLIASDDGTKMRKWHGKT